MRALVLQILKFPAQRDAVVAIIALGAALLVPLALAIISLQALPSILLYICILIFGSAAQFGALQAAPLLSGKTVLAVATLAHLIALAGTPAFEDDHYRFVWDGWRTLQTGTPYGLAPEAFFTSPDVPSAYADVLSGNNYPEYPTIYGPVLQAIFWAGILLTGADSLGIRILFAALNLGVTALLLRTHLPNQVALYAWSPVVVSEVALHARPDGILALFVLASLILTRRHRILAGICLGLAASTKIVALAVWPLLFRSGWGSTLAAVLTVAAVYAPFLALGLGGRFESTGTFASEWRFNPLGFALLDAVLPETAARIAAAFIGVMLILLLHAISRSAGDTPIAAIFAVALLLSPAVNAWYILWILPFAVGRPNSWPWLLSLALPLSYLTGLNLDSASLAPFEVHPAAYALQVTVILAALLMSARNAFRSPAR